MATIATPETTFERNRSPPGVDSIWVFGRRK